MKQVYPYKNKKIASVDIYKAGESVSVEKLDEAKSKIEKDLKTINKTNENNNKEGK